MKVVDLSPGDRARIEQAARILHDAFLGRSADWQTMDSAREEVAESFAEGRISRVALGPSENVIGWIGGISLYEGHVLEVHPLVVAAAWQGRGVGRALVQDLEGIAAATGVSTLFLGTDDETGETNASGRDLYRDIPSAIRELASTPDGSTDSEVARGKRRLGHAFEFYQRLGFTVVGLLPDANGPGKPDIFMAKRVASGSAPSSG